MRGKSNVSCDGAMPSIRRYHGQSPARLSNIDRRQLSAAYPQSQKREIWPVQQRLAAHEFTGVNLGGPPPEKFKLSHLQRSLSTPINHCGGNTASRCALEHTRRPAAPPPCTARQDGVVWCEIDPPNAQRHRAEYDRSATLRLRAGPSNPQHHSVGGNCPLVRWSLKNDWLC